MNETDPKWLATMPRPWLLNSFYHLLMSITKKRGGRSLGKINAKLFPKGEIVQLPHGARLFCPPAPHFFGYIVGHETHISTLMNQLIRPGDVCFDVGANIGYFSNIMGAIVGPTGQVWAYEPVPENYEILQMNAILANRVNQVVHPIHAAVSDHAGVVRIVRKQASTAHQVSPIEGHVSPDSECVKSVSLHDEYVSHKIEKTISVLKVDVEGHEWPVINGCKQLIKERVIRNMIVEVTPDTEIKSIQNIQNLFDQCDVRYKCWLDNKWQITKLVNLPSRTDVWATLQDR